MKPWMHASLLAIILAGCGSRLADPPPSGETTGGRGGSRATGGRGGNAGPTGGGPGAGGATGGGAGSSATGGSGAAGGTSGGAGGSGGATASDAPASDAPAAEASAPDLAAAEVPATPDAAGDTPVSPTPAGQGPTAAGTIAYSQDFEKGDMAGLGRSPASITPDRVQVIDDPLGQRGKVLRIRWLPGDDFRSAPQFRPKTFVSNNSAFNYQPGDKVSYAWGYMTDSTYIGATLAQNITGGDPIWMIQGRDEGILDIIPGTVRSPVRLEAKRWYDFRVDVDYLPGNAGLVEMFIDGQRIYSRRGGLPQGPRGHWDGGIYLTGFGQMGNGNSTARTVYFSNLSCGRR